MDSDNLRALVAAGIDGDEAAWHELVRRYAGLVTHVIRRYRLAPADAQDVGQLVWLRLVEHLGQLREPAALPGWLATTTRHECERHLRSTGRSIAVDPLTMVHPARDTAQELDAVLLATERRQVLLDGLTELDPAHRELLMMLAADPPYAYAEIGRVLGIPVGSIGPTRSRILEKLRNTSAVRAYLEANAEVARTEGGRHAIAELE
jgi:RNA polymerase sigma factor (sigma-70 family)